MTKKTLFHASVAAAILACTIPALAINKQDVSDAAITSKAVLLIKKDYPTVKIITNKNEVTLSGNVNAEADADNLIEQVSSIKGVKKVDTKDLLVNGSEHVLVDAAITANVKGRLIQEKLLKSGADVNPWVTVSTTNKEVTLSGTAKSQRQIDNAVKIANSVEGVTSVKSDQLQVK